MARCLHVPGGVLHTLEALLHSTILLHATSLQHAREEKLLNLQCTLQMDQFQSSDTETHTYTKAQN